MTRHVATVFGASGFIGRHVVRRLAADGWTVRAAMRDPEAGLFLKTMGMVGQIVPTYANVMDPASVNAAVADADVVINLVGILYESGKSTFDAVHVDGAKNVADACKAAGVKSLVHLSALGADADAESNYARTKGLGEQAILAAYPDATILRPSVIFGPEDQFFNLFASLSRFTPVMPVIGAMPKITKRDGMPWVELLGDGGAKFQPVYVGDVASAVMKCLSGSKTKGKTYDLAGPSVYNFKDLMTLISSVTRRKRMLVPMPYVLAEAYGVVLQMLPKPILTRDHVLMMQTDNVLTGPSGLEALGLDATPAESVLPLYLNRFRPVSAQSIRPA